MAPLKPAGNEAGVAFMTTVRSLDIKVVYRGGSLRRKLTPARLHPTTSRLALLGLLNLAVAGALCYATWWPADRFIYLKFVLKTPIDATQLAVMFNLPSRELAPAPTGDSSTAATQRFVGETATAVIGVTGYAWLTLATFAACALAVSGGAAVGKAGDPPLRRIGRILFIGGLLGLAWGAYETFSQFGAKYPPAHLRWSMVALVVLCGLLGLAIGRRVKGLTRLAAATLILSAVGTAVGLYLGGLAGAISPDYSSALFLALLFLVHSFYGWTLLAFSPRFIT